VAASFDEQRLRGYRFAENALQRSNGASALTLSNGQPSKSLRASLLIAMTSLGPVSTPCQQSITALVPGGICTFIGVVKAVSDILQSTRSDWFYTLELTDDSGGSFDLNVFQRHPEELYDASPGDLCIARRILVKQSGKQLSGEMGRRDLEQGAMVVCFRPSDGKWNRAWSVPDVPQPGFPFDRVSADAPFERCKAFSAKRYPRNLCSSNEAATSTGAQGQ